MKKTIFFNRKTGQLIVALLLSFSLIACSDNSSSNNSKNNTNCSTDESRCEARQNNNL